MTSPAKTINIFLRILQLVFAVIILALTGALIRQVGHVRTLTRVNYSIFAAAFGVVTHLYLFPATVVDSIASPLAMTILDAFNTLFFLCAAIAMSARSCTDYSLLRHNGITRGRRCREAHATTAFEWFAFAAFLGSLMISAWNLKQKSGTPRSRANTEGAVSQV